MKTEEEVYEFLKPWREGLAIYENDLSTSDMWFLGAMRDAKYFLTGILSSGCRYCQIENVTDMLRFVKRYEKDNNIIYPYVIEDYISDISPSIETLSDTFPTIKKRGRPFGTSKNK